MVAPNPAPRSAAVEVRGLRKRYGVRDVLAGVDLTVGAGSVFGLLGPNGAGKTTTVEILEGHRRRSAGEVRVLGVDPERGHASLRERMGVMLQEGGLESYLTVREALDATRGYYRQPLERAVLLESVGLEKEASVRVGRLSGGQRRRLALALALAGDPEILFLDEPTVGFDPEARRSAWQLMRSLGGRGTTIMLTTNSMDEAGAICDELAMLVGGRVVAHGTPSEVMDGARAGSVIRFRLAEGSPPLPAAIRGAVVSSDDGRVELRSPEPVALLRELSGWALSQDVALVDLSVAPRSLEDAYVELAGLREEPDPPPGEPRDGGGAPPSAERRA